jgi:hypothetical protein
MQQVCMDVLRARVDNIDMAQVRAGFHMPPLMSVHHLHLHIIYPATQMAFIYRKFIFAYSRFFKSVRARRRQHSPFTIYRWILSKKDWRNDLSQVFCGIFSFLLAFADSGE